MPDDRWAYQLSAAVTDHGVKIVLMELSSICSSNELYDPSPAWKKFWTECGQQLDELVNHLPEEP